MGAIHLLQRCTVQWISGLLLLSSPNSSNLPPGLCTKKKKNVHSSLRAVFLALSSLSPSLHLSSLDLKTEGNAREDKLTHMCTLNILSYETDPCNPLCFIYDRRWMPVQNLVWLRPLSLLFPFIHVLVIKEGDHSLMQAWMKISRWLLVGESDSWGNHSVFPQAPP